MAKKKELLIVESPTKAHTISRLLKGKMTVLSSKGHIADLPKSRLGVDIEHGFAPDYILIRGKGKVLQELRAAAHKADVVYLGCDPDREGEAIAFSVANEIRNGATIKRVLFYEITAQGLKAAFAAPTEIDMNKVYSHRARRVLDRLVGYLVSPLLWRIVKTGLSAGRVQTVALRMIVEREREIAQFRPEEYWVVKAVFAKEDGAVFEAQLVRLKAADVKLRTSAEVELVRTGCAQAHFRVGAVKCRERHKRPLPPFITATLVQDAAQRLGLSSRRTTRIAQELFEGIDLADETVGLITYPRTDSFRVAGDFVTETRRFIAEQFGPDYLPPEPRRYPDRKGTQGAHEAIRPTGIDRTPESVRKFLTPDQFKLYDLIYRRFLASQLADAVYELTEVLVTAEDYTFRADALQCRFPGFEKVYGTPDKEKILPELAPGEPVLLKEFRPEQKFTQPPPRYSEATLIKRLEVNGIGRPSTYAQIVSTLFERKYIERKEGKLQPTELGMVVNDVLIPRFANIFEIGFTREMEKELDLIEEGTEKWPTVVQRFYTPFKEDLDKVAAEAQDIRQDLGKELAEACPQCGAKLIERWGRFGKFIACSNYPECRYIKKEKAQELSEKCPDCGKPLVAKTGRYGRFVACSGYPECKYTRKEAPAALKPGDKCPKCGKELIAKTGRAGTFVACSGYPECRFLVRPKRPPARELPEKCPDCGKPLVAKTGRFGTFVGCSGYPQCRYVKKESKKPGV